MQLIDWLALLALAVATMLVPQVVRALDPSIGVTQYEVLRVPGGGAKLFRYLDIQPVRDRAGNPQVSAFQFELEDGRLVVCAWNAGMAAQSMDPPPYRCLLEHVPPEEPE